MIGHRGEAFKNLYREIHPHLQELVRHETARFSFYLIGLGRDGSRRSAIVVASACSAACAARSPINGSTSRRRCGKEAEPLAG